MDDVIDEELAEEQFNDPNRVPVGELQKNLFGIIKEVQQKNARKLITRAGRIVAVLSPLREVAMLDNLLKNER